MTNYSKLVRDKIPDILTNKGEPYTMRIASAGEYRMELQQKLLEEVNEFIEAGAIEELADVLEVIEALKNLPQYSEVEQVRKRKKQERGGFEKGIILTGRK